MKLFVDDERPAPRGWLLAQDCRDARELLLVAEDANHQIEAISLDHDLGCTGETIMPLLYAIQAYRWWPRELYIHTANEDAEEVMLGFIREHAPAGVLRGYGCNFWGTGPDTRIQNWENPA
ncbi:hypothetical protein P3H15_32650 [Rhodococcus sp. T2V]|uniref:cyclic-phosphate processing receiver domain-containing protein n=1 Tax=Rhodococcus sp. T2V TaxID=3034164 RepID=UPI0023E1D04B|nr:cyclic-phosphate processing receiver domain-containing protein [Rhodococcus sp. T2V]MDF3309770.1 hypothetical protein [Rhodococcus sp. T2V]